MMGLLTFENFPNSLKSYKLTQLQTLMSEQGESK